MRILKFICFLFFLRGARSACENKHDYCNFWKWAGECQKNLAWMPFNCAKSCGTCTDGSDTDDLADVADEIGAALGLCGKSFREPDLDSGDGVVKASSYPWTVVIELERATKPAFCSGTLISSQWVLTAASCLDAETTDGEAVNMEDSPIRFGVRVGAHDLSVPDGIRTGITQVATSGDVALLQLVHKGSFSMLPALMEKHADSIVLQIGLPVCLSGDEPSDGTESVVNLWKTETDLKDSDSTSLQQGIFNSGESLPDLVCDGDPGGPVIMESDGKWYQYGVITSSSCSDSAYAKVSDYCSFIEETTGESLCA